MLIRPKLSQNSTFHDLLLYFKHTLGTELGEGAVVALDDAFQGHHQVFPEELEQQFDFDVCLGIVAAGCLKVALCFTEDDTSDAGFLQGKGLDGLQFLLATA